MEAIRVLLAVSRMVLLSGVCPCSAMTHGTLMKRYQQLKIRVVW